MRVQKNSGGIHPKIEGCYGGLTFKKNMSSTTEQHDYVSAVFVRLLQPIADLCEQMLLLPQGEPNEVQASFRENGYAISIVALAAFLLEGACGRSRYVCGDKPMSPAGTFRDFGRHDLADNVEEIFVVRDAIAHAHLWKGKITFTGNNVRFAEQAVLLPGYGDDKKFKRIVDLGTRTTRRLKLDVLPTRIDRRSAIAVLKESALALQFLESRDRNFVHLMPHDVYFQGDLVPFYKWVSELPI